MTCEVALYQMRLFAVAMDVVTDCDCRSHSRSSFHWHLLRIQGYDVWAHLPNDEESISVEEINRWLARDSP